MREYEATLYSKDGVLNKAISHDSFELDLQPIQKRFKDLHMIVFRYRPNSLAEWIDTGTVFVNDWK